MLETSLIVVLNSVYEESDGVVVVVVVEAMRRETGGLASRVNMAQILVLCVRNCTL